MGTEIVPLHAGPLVVKRELPAIVTDAGAGAQFAYEEFFAGIESPHTERAYRRAVHRFLGWAAEAGLALPHIMPDHVSR